MSDLCRSYGISRETGYVWWRRYQQGGWEAMRELDRAPMRRPNQTGEGVEEAVRELRRQHMRWGPRKLKRVLERDGGSWPAASTIGAILARAGLVVGRKRRRRVPPYSEPFLSADTCNRVWCVDFKGWFRTRDGERIDPLTISDAHSRYLLRCQAVEKADTPRVQAVFEAAFREHGLPDAIRSDNGAPFASRAVSGLSRLSVMWMKLGIVPERIAPGHPEQNGRHERMHRTLKQETASPAQRNRRSQQRAFDRFRQEYNQVRPHEALQMRTPAEIYVPSRRVFPARLPAPEYDSGLEVRTVNPAGEIAWRGHRHVFLSETLRGERVGLEALDDRWWCVWFASFAIACFDSWQLRMRPLSVCQGFYRAEAGEGETAPFPCTPTPKPADRKVSGMSPV